MKKNGTTVEQELVRVWESRLARFSSRVVVRKVLSIERRRKDPAFRLRMDEFPTEHDFALELAIHPEWRNYNLADVFGDGAIGADLRSVYFRWLEENGPRRTGRRLQMRAWTQDLEEKMRSLSLEVFFEGDDEARVKMRGPYFLPNESGEVMSYDSSEERDGHTLLRTIGAADEAKEGETIHLRIPEPDKNKGWMGVDCVVKRIDGVRLVEIHSIRDTDIKRGDDTVEKLRQRKLDFLIRAGFVDFDLFVVQKPRELFNVLKHPRMEALIAEKFKPFTEQIFQKQLSLSHRVGLVYDIKERWKLLDG